MNQKTNSQSVLVLILLDVLTIVSSYFIANYIRFGQMKHNVTPQGYLDIMWVIVIIYLLKIVFSVGKKSWLYMSFFRDLYEIVVTHLYIAAFLFAYLYAVKISSLYSRFQVYMFFVVDVVLMFVLHMLAKYLLMTKFRKTSYCERVLLVTTSDRVEKTISKIKKTKNWYFRIKAIVILDKDMKGQYIDGININASAGDCFENAQREAFDAVLINVDDSYPYDKNEFIENFIDMGMIVHVNIAEFERPISAGRKLENMGLLGVVTYNKCEYNFYQIIIKRVMDIVGALVGMMLFGLAMIFVAPLIKLESPGPVLFRQRRVGKNGRRFDIYKFRSMYADAEERKAELMEQNEMQGNMFKMYDDPRITKVGKFIRKTSIDELPQFINVLKGDMSLVGTRPPTEDEFENYTAYQRRRISIKPGITGLWQVSGRSSITDFEDVVKLDCEYIDNWSVIKDIKILIKTVWVVLFGRGAE